MGLIYPFLPQVHGSQYATSKAFILGMSSPSRYIDPRLRVVVQKGRRSFEPKHRRLLPHMY